VISKNSSCENQKLNINVLPFSTEFEVEKKILKDLLKIKVIFIKNYKIYQRHVYNLKNHRRVCPLNIILIMVG
jgi:hypothetical protein